MLEVVLVRRVGVGQVLDPRLAPPHHCPVFSFGGSEDVVVLRVDAVERIVRLRPLAESLVGMHLPDERPARQIAVDHHLVVRIDTAEVRASKLNC